MSAAAVMIIIAEALKASGVVVRVELQDFIKILSKTDNPMVIYSEGRFFAKRHQYLTSYKGFAFFVKTAEPIALAAGTEVVRAGKIWIPG